ncbi:MAG: RDD family protein [Polynucleobacter sp.]
MNPAEINALPTPRFWRRVFCNLYEQLLLVGVLALTFMVPNLLIGVLFGIAIPSWLSFFYLYGVLGFYFVWYWRRNGQTLAMQTWRMQIVAEDGGLLAKNQALWRYVRLAMDRALPHYSRDLSTTRMANHWFIVFSFSFPLAA